MKYEIKLNDTDVVVISDEEIKDGFVTNGIEVFERSSMPEYSNEHANRHWKKVIATISPFKIEGLPMLELPNPAYDWFASKSYSEQHSLSDKYFESINPSLLTNEQVAEMYKLEVPSQEEDVEKLAKLKYPITKGGSMWMPTIGDYSKANKREGFIEGYKAAQSKQHSEKDAEKLALGAFKAAMQFCHTDFSDAAYNRFRTWFSQNYKAVQKQYSEENTSVGAMNANATGI